MAEIKKNVVDLGALGSIALVDYSGSDLSAVNAARCSYGTYKEELDEKDVKLIKYLVKHDHGTPFEHNFISFRVRCPKPINVQWIRHRTGWCLSGDTELHFNQPYNGDLNRYLLRDFYSRWQDPRKRARMKKMPIRSMDIFTGELISTFVTDVWESGEKTVHEIELLSGITIKASEDHLFYSDKGWVKLKDLSATDSLYSVRRVGDIKKFSDVVFSAKDFQEEQWVDFYLDDNYKVSSLGRVKSKRTGKAKATTLNASNRAVFSYTKDGCTKVEQVSRAVALSFSEDPTLNLSSHVLHVNDNPLDNRIANLYFGNDYTNAQDRKVNGGALKNRLVLDRIVNIRNNVGVEMTYDLSVEHSDHNFIANGVVTHNSYNEISGRYVEFKDDFYIPEKFRKQHETSKQASVSHDWCELKEAELKKIYTDSLNQSYIAYTKLIEEGVAKEQARMLMPFGFITEFYASCNLRSFMHWYKLRSDEHAQYEIRQFAEAAMSLIKDKYPVTVKAMLDKESGK